MSSCSLPGGCNEPSCPFCNGEFDAKFPYVLVRCATHLKQGRCRLISGHDGDCEPERTAKAEKADVRDGDPKLAGERKRSDLAFRKRQRAGANWVPRERRV